MFLASMENCVRLNVMLFIIPHLNISIIKLVVMVMGYWSGAQITTCTRKQLSCVVQGLFHTWFVSMRTWNGYSLAL
jgi:hypothetical protein